MCEHSESVKAIGAALLAVQRALGRAKKDAKNSHFGNAYATFDSVLEAVRTPLNENGIVLLQSPVESAPGFFCLETMLLHAESGEWVSSKLTLPLAKGDAQGIGSAISYAKRYALTALVGLGTGDDDDGEGCSRRPASSQPQRQVPARAQEQPKRLNDEQIEGVVFRKVEEDGSRYVVAEGRTHEAAEALKARGFRWNGKTWWRKVA